MKSFVEIESKRLSFVPGPKYLQHKDWRDERKGRAGKFLQNARKTFTQEIMEYEKNRPAPSKFDNYDKLKKQQKVLGNYLM